jgi:poly(3-hydroxybutyrate) depolymerase
VSARRQTIGRWPKISVWHGTADNVVRPSNADHIIRQWLDMQELPEHASGEEKIGRHTRRFWKDANGVTCASSPKK